jgi:hypothetical protein
MASQNDYGVRTFPSTGSGVSAFLVVDVNADGTISAVAPGATGIGVTQEDVPGPGSNLSPSGTPYYGRVKLWSAPGTFMIQASGTAITCGNSYTIISGGFVGVSASGVTAVRSIDTQGNGIAANGIICEFQPVGVN